MSVGAGERGPAHRYVMVRLAAEGIPMGAIARSLKQTFGEVESALKEAVEAGEIVGLPRADWPTSVPRHERKPALPRRSRLPEHVVSDIMVIIKATEREARIVGVLLKHDVAVKSAIYAAVYDEDSDIGPKIIDVFICRLRKKLEPFGVAIETVWGRGYRISREDRAKLEQLAEEKLS